MDLPQLSVVLSGVDRWDINHTERVIEPRLIGSVRELPGCQSVVEFRTPPWEEETASPFDSWANIGVPVYPFPRWLRCTRCNLLAPVDRERFQLDVPVYRPDRARYFHDKCHNRRPGGPLIFGPTHPFDPIKTTASFYRWPLEAREAFFATTARLHAKCVIADRSSLLITSANLTSAGINDNIELGVLIEAGSLPESLSRHLELLIEAGMLEPVSG